MKFLGVQSDHAHQLELTSKINPVAEIVSNFSILDTDIITSNKFNFNQL